MTITQPVPGPLPPLPTIPSEEQTPLVKVLLALLEHYQATDEQLRTIIGELEQRVCALEAEVQRLKNPPLVRTSNRAPWTKTATTMIRPRAVAPVA